MKSVCLILPAAYREAGNALAVALGHDQPPGNTYSVPLSPTGQEPATHYGCHTVATQGFVDMIVAGKANQLPPGLPEGTANLIEALNYSVREATVEPAAHWAEMIAANGMQRIIPATA